MHRFEDDANRFQLTTKYKRLFAKRALHRAISYSQLFFFNLHSIRGDLNLVFHKVYLISTMELRSYGHLGGWSAALSLLNVCSVRTVSPHTQLLPESLAAPSCLGPPAGSGSLAQVLLALAACYVVFGVYCAYRGSDGSPGTLGSDVARLALLSHRPRLTQRPLGALAALERQQRSSVRGSVLILDNSSR